MNKFQQANKNLSDYYENETAFKFVQDETLKSAIAGLLAQAQYQIMELEHADEN